MLVLRLPAWFPLGFLTSALLGVLHSLSFLDDHAWPLQILTLAGLIAQTQRAIPEQHQPLAAAQAGFAFGLGWFLAGTHWIYISLHTYGLMAAPLAALATFLLCAYISLFPALACALRAWISQRLRLDLTTSALLAFPAAWMFSEWLRGTLFTGYPWLASGYAHVGSPLAGYAPIVGVYGVALFAALLAAAITLIGARRNTGLAAALLISISASGALLANVEWTQASGRALSVRLLQGNIAQEMKFSETEFNKTVATYLRLVEQQRADLIVLPETALPRFFHQLPPEVLERLQHFATSTRSTIAIGIPVLASGERYFNSVVAIKPEGIATQRYDKMHLVPFGEFIPPGFRWFVDLMHIPLGDFSAGTSGPAPMMLADTAVAFNICYEDLFGAQIAAQAKTAALLINVSNVAWFGDSLALPQHLQASRMRAIETGRPMLRATNTGMTAVVDGHGKVQSELTPFTEGSLNVHIQGTTGSTPYVLGADYAVLLLGALMLAVAAALNRFNRFNRFKPRRSAGAVRDAVQTR